MYVTVGVDYKQKKTYYTHGNMAQAFLTDLQRTLWREGWNKVRGHRECGHMKEYEDGDEGQWVGWRTLRVLYFL